MSLKISAEVLQDEEEVFSLLAIRMHPLPRFSAVVVADADDG